MAAATHASEPAAHGSAVHSGAAEPPQIRTIEVADVIACIEQGVKDFVRAPQYGLFFGGIYAIGGLLITWLTLEFGYFYLAYPCIMGFALFAPFGAAGTYEVSRRLENNEPLLWSVVLGAVWGRAGRELAWLALVSLFTFIIWLDLAVFLFLMFYGLNVPTLSQLVVEVFTTAYGVTFLVVGNALGAVIALIVFSFTAVSPPMIVDRDVDFITAMITSVKAVRANPRPMLAWAIVIGADLAIAFATVFVALLIVFPVLGHTTWRLYRKLIA